MLLLWRARERGSASGLTGRIGLFSAEPAAPHLQEGAENSLLGANLALTRLRPRRVGLLCEMRSSLRDAGGKVRTRDVCADPLDACLQYFLRKC